MSHAPLRVLVVTPYSPLNRHDHAADDIARSFLTELASEVDVHVYAADGTVDGPVELAPGRQVTMHAAAPAKPLGPWHRLAPYPFRLRLTWQRAHTDDVRRLLRTITPDVLHTEYLQPAEAAVTITHPVRTATLHDITERVVLAEARQEPSLPRALFHRWEYLTVARAERRLTRAADHAFVFSERDREIISRRGTPVSRVNLGVVCPERDWHGKSSHTLLFAGAMWRTPNELAATFLVREVMPHVWSTAPDVRLRIAGARPTAQVEALGADPRVEVVGQVDDLDDEYGSAFLNLAPSLVEAGVLLKSLRSMALGCPVLLNTASATPIDGLVPNVHAIVVDRAKDMARAITDLLADPVRADQLGQAGRGLIRDRYSWGAYVEEHQRVWTRLVARAR